MQISFFFGMIMFAFLEVVRTHFALSYGIEAKDSIEPGMGGHHPPVTCSNTSRWFRA